MEARTGAPECHWALERTSRCASGLHSRKAGCSLESLRPFSSIMASHIPPIFCTALNSTIHPPATVQMVHSAWHGAGVFNVYHSCQFQRPRYTDQHPGWTSSSSKAASLHLATRMPTRNKSRRIAKDRSFEEALPTGNSFREEVGLLPLSHRLRPAWSKLKMRRLKMRSRESGRHKKRRRRKRQRSVCEHALLREK